MLKFEEATVHNTCHFGSLSNLVQGIEGYGGGNFVHWVLYLEERTGRPELVEYRQPAKLDVSEEQ